MRLTCRSAPSSNLLYNGTSNNGSLSIEDFTTSAEPITHAMNEIVLHRGRSPHLTRLNISIDGVFLTEDIVLHRGRSPHLTRLNISIDGVFLTEAIVLHHMAKLIIGRWTDSLDADRINSLLPIGIRSINPSKPSIYPLDTDLSTKSQFPTADFAANEYGRCPRRS